MPSTRTRRRWSRATSTRSSSRRTRPRRRVSKDPAKRDPATAEGQDGKRQPAGPSEERRGDSPTAEKPPFYEEKVLFRDPYATLAEIAASSNQASGQRRTGALTSAEEDGLKGGDAYRDPFDPGYWKLAPQAAGCRRARSRASQSEACAARRRRQTQIRPTRSRSGAARPMMPAAPRTRRGGVRPQPCRLYCRHRLLRLRHPARDGSAAGQPSGQSRGPDPPD